MTTPEEEAPGWKQATRAGVVALVDERGNDRHDARYRHAEDFTEGGRATSRLGLVVDGEPVALFAVAGGATGVHRHSAVVRGDRLYLAVGNRLCCVQPKPYRRIWSTVVDPITCFGVHHDAAHDALISHGELQVARLSDAGYLLWSASGADIFTGECRLLPHCIEVVDFDGRRYGFDYAEGRAVEP